VLVGTNFIFYEGDTIRLTDVINKIVKKLKLIGYIEYDYYQATLSDVRDFLTQLSVFNSNKNMKKLLLKAWNDDKSKRRTIVRDMAPKNNFQESNYL